MVDLLQNHKKVMKFAALYHQLSKIDFAIALGNRTLHKKTKLQKSNLGRKGQKQDWHAQQSPRLCILKTDC